MNSINEKNVMPEWASQYENYPEPFKIKDGETKTLKFLDSGNVHHDKRNNKDDIVFVVESEAHRMAWYVNTKSYSTLADIRNLGFPLEGKTITLSRKGNGRFDTRYTIALNV